VLAFIIDRVNQKGLFTAVSASWDMSKNQASLTVHTVGELASGYITCYRTDESQKYQSSGQCALAPQGKEEHLSKFDFTSCKLITKKADHVILVNLSLMISL
jgi:hypothetical protein